MDNLFDASFEQGPQSEPLGLTTLREQLMLCANNYHHFVLEIIPQMDLNCNQESMLEIYRWIRRYQQIFRQFADEGDVLAATYLRTSSHLEETIRRLLGLPDIEPESGLRSMLVHLFE